MSSILAREWGLNVVECRLRQDMTRPVNMTDQQHRLALM